MLYPLTLRSRPFVILLIPEALGAGERRRVHGRHVRFFQELPVLVPEEAVHGVRRDRAQQEANPGPERADRTPREGGRPNPGRVEEPEGQPGGEQPAEAGRDRGSEGEAAGSGPAQGPADGPDEAEERGPVPDQHEGPLRKGRPKVIADAADRVQSEAEEAGAGRRQLAE